MANHVLTCLVSEGLDRQPEVHFVADGRDAELHPELGALEAAGGIAAAHVALARGARVQLAFPALDAQGERPGHPEHGELTLDERRGVAVPLHRIALRSEEHTSELQ